MTERNTGRDRGSRDDNRDSGRDRNRGGEDRGRDRVSNDRGSDRGSERGGRESTGRGDDRSIRGGSKGFSYKARSMEAVNKRSSMGAKDFDTYLRDDIKMFKAHDGPNTIRVIPPTWENPEHYGIDIWVHYGIGPDSQTYLCLHKMKNEECPICDERMRARSGGESEEYVKDLEPTRRVLFFLVDRDNEKDGVQAWPAPWTIDRDVTKVSIDRRNNAVLAVDDPENGYDIEFDKGGKGVATKYSGIAIARRESPLGDDRWLDFATANPLPDVLEYYSYDHIQKAFGGGGAHKTRADRDRDDDKGRGGNDRDRGRGDDRNDSRDRGRGDDRGDSRSRREAPEPQYTWEGIHAMNGKELDAMVETEKLEIDPDKAESDDELADWICEDLKISKPGGRRETARDDPPKEEGSTRRTLGRG